MEIRINDDFDLKKIVDSGQCFRPKEIEPNRFRFIVGENILHISKCDENIFEADCTPEDWERVWKNYFDLETNYADIRRDVETFAAGKPYEKILLDALEFGKGIRILNQEPFEMLISFIISQRKNIPAIRSSVERICAKFGRRVGEIYLFPRLEEISSAQIEDLKGLGLAYRKDYIRNALDKILSGEINLDALKNFSDGELVEELKKIKGVGDKVANCVALFAYHRVNRAPVDVWIKRAIDEDFNGENIFDAFGKNAGILQQYIFYHKRSSK
ncbi:MAG: DNA-3-methyladenine glycosylase 2 family protein [Selenomonadaceae bacterium]|nr:DNA-3-methyladenine glycosylase 2 family protein [Selenomonadaceae bacterium]